MTLALTGRSQGDMVRTFPARAR